MARRLLTPEEISRFREDGFLALDHLLEEGEVTQLRTIFGKLFSDRSGWREGAQFDLAGTDDGGAAQLPQLLNPARFAPELEAAPFRRVALDLARQLLGPEAEPWFEHAISKPAGRGAATPWHQDEAHRDDTGVTYQQISVWIPLHDATLESGCMRYLRGSHHGPVLPHHSPNDDPRVMALECSAPIDAEVAVPCPLPPGGAVIHHARTLHSAGPNISTAPRTAYVLAFRSAITPDPTFLGYAWNWEKRTAAQARSRAWKNRGGPLGRAFRAGALLLRRAWSRLLRQVRPRRD